FQHDISGEFTPNIGAGLYWHNEKSYVGLSVPNFLETTRYDDNIQSTMTQRMRYYLMGGHVFELNPTLKFKPAVLLKATDGAPLQASVTANLLISNKFTIGATYRWEEGVGEMIVYQITHGLFIGYIYNGKTPKLAN